MPRELFIPSISTVLTLAEPWTFMVYDEYRNHDLVRMTGLQNSHLNGIGPWRRAREAGYYTLPAGTQLAVDRIYIKKGAPDFDSMTFRVGDPTQLTKQKKPKVIRFWAKLRDVNTMVIE